VISQKGGAGNTTLALHTAVAAELASDSTVLIDMDPLGTAEAWRRIRAIRPAAGQAAQEIKPQGIAAGEVTALCS
jgi:chromosome partitioning protein